VCAYVYINIYIILYFKEKFKSLNINYIIYLIMKFKLWLLEELFQFQYIHPMFLSSSFHTPSFSLSSMATETNKHSLWEETPFKIHDSTSYLGFYSVVNTQRTSKARRIEGLLKLIEAVFQHGQGQRGIPETLLGAFQSSQTEFVSEEGKVQNNGSCHGLLCSHLPCFHCLQRYCESCKFNYISFFQPCKFMFYSSNWKSTYSFCLLSHA